MDDRKVPSPGFRKLGDVAKASAFFASLSPEFIEPTYLCPTCLDTGYTVKDRRMYGDLYPHAWKCQGGTCRWWRSHREDVRAKLAQKETEKASDRGRDEEEA